MRRHHTHTCRNMDLRYACVDEHVTRNISQRLSFTWQIRMENMKKKEHLMQYRNFNSVAEMLDTFYTHQIMM